METRFIETDFLIIGGGSAGCMAAIRALEINPDLKVVIFEKSDINYSGSIARGMDALNIVAIPNMTSPELYVEAITEGCQNVVDAGPSHLMAARSYRPAQKTAEMGRLFPDGRVRKFQNLEVSCEGQVSDGHGGAEPEGHDRPRRPQEPGPWSPKPRDGPRLLKDGKRSGRRDRIQHAAGPSDGLPCQGGPGVQRRHRALLTARIRLRVRHL